MRLHRNQKYILGPFLTYAEIHTLELAMDGNEILDMRNIEVLLRFILKN